MAGRAPWNLLAPSPMREEQGTHEGGAEGREGNGELSPAPRRPWSESELGRYPPPPPGPGALEAAAATTAETAVPSDDGAHPDIPRGSTLGKDVWRRYQGEADTRTPPSENLPVVSAAAPPLGSRGQESATATLEQRAKEDTGNNNTLGNTDQPALGSGAAPVIKPNERSFLFRVFLSDYLVTAGSSLSSETTPFSSSSQPGEGEGASGNVVAAKKDTRRRQEIRACGLVALIAENKGELFSRLTDALQDQLQLRGKLKGFRFSALERKSNTGTPAAPSTQQGGEAAEVVPKDETTEDNAAGSTPSATALLLGDRKTLEEMQFFSAADGPLDDSHYGTPFKEPDPLPGPFLRAGAAAVNLMGEDLPTPPPPPKKPTFENIPSELNAVPIFAARTVRFKVTALHQTDGPHSPKHEQQQQLRAAAYVDSIASLVRALSSTLNANVFPVQVFFLNPPSSSDGRDRLAHYHPLRHISELAQFTYLLVNFTIDPVSGLSRKGNGEEVPLSIPFYAVHPQQQGFDDEPAIKKHHLAGASSLSPKRPPGKEGGVGGSHKKEDPRSYTELMSVNEEESARTRSERARREFENRLRRRTHPKSYRGSIEPNTSGGGAHRDGDVPEGSTWSEAPAAAPPRLFRFFVPRRLQTPPVPHELLPLHRRHPSSKQTPGGNKPLVPAGGMVQKRREEVGSDDERADENDDIFARWNLHNQEREEAFRQFTPGLLPDRQTLSVMSKIKKKTPGYPGGDESEVGSDQAPSSVLTKVEGSPPRLPLALHRDVEFEGLARFPAAMAKQGRALKTPQTLSGGGPEGVSVWMRHPALIHQGDSVGGTRGIYPPAEEKKFLVHLTSTALREGNEEVLLEHGINSSDLVRLTSDVVQAFRSGYDKNIPILFPLSKTDSERLRVLVEERLKLELGATGRLDRIKGRRRKKGSTSVDSHPQQEQSQPKPDRRTIPEGEGETGLVHEFSEYSPESAAMGEDGGAPSPRVHGPSSAAGGVRSEVPQLALTKPNYNPQTGELRIFATCSADIFTQQSSAHAKQDLVAYQPPHTEKDTATTAPPYRWYVERRSGGLSYDREEIALEAMIALGIVRDFVLSRLPPVTLGLEMNLKGHRKRRSGGEGEEEAGGEPPKMTTDLVLQPGVQYTIGVVVSHHTLDEDGDERPLTLHECHHFVIPSLMTEGTKTCTV